MIQRAGGVSRPFIRSPPATQEEKSRAALLPESFDWTDVDGVSFVSPIRDQGSCGSCYAFASAALVEARLRIATRNARQDVLSTQVRLIKIYSCMYFIRENTSLLTTIKLNVDTIQDQ